MRLIDADALMEMANDIFDMVGNACVLMNAKDFVRNLIDNQPTIDSVKHGVWLKYPGEVVSDDGLWGEALYDCSNCGRTVHVATRYCSKCGTKMDKQGEIQVRWKNEHTN